MASKPLSATIKPFILCAVAVFVFIILIALIVFAIIAVAISLDLMEIAPVQKMARPVSLLDITKQVSLTVVYSLAFLFLAATASAMYMIMRKIYGSGDQSSSTKLPGGAGQKKADTDNQESSPDGEDGKDRTISQDGGNGTRKVYIASQNGGSNGIRTDNHITMLVGILISGIFVLMAFRVDHTMSTLKDNIKDNIKEEVLKEVKTQIEAVEASVAEAKETAEIAAAAKIDLAKLQLEAWIGKLDREVAELREKQVEQKTEVAKESAQVVAEAVKREIVAKATEKDTLEEIKTFDENLSKGEIGGQAEAVVKAEIAIAEERINEAENTRKEILEQVKGGEFQSCAGIVLQVEKGVKPYETSEDQLNAASELSERGCFEEAINIYKKVYEDEKKKGDAQDLKIAAEAKFYQSGNYLGLDKEQEAIKVLEMVVKDYEKKEDEDNEIKKLVLRAKAGLAALDAGSNNKERVEKLRAVVDEYKDEGGKGIEEIIERIKSATNFYDIAAQIESHLESSQ